ncbi:amino acid/amide ABC transporter membrane protein 2 (HAAT family) [Asanoa ferruginea]|uniref:Amino acid/amide ABC transporter membrane protein 2 (HAAT family) n=1 Tax=Asanoa ferruginea TaxID=53367 RepID=A0A3D9ZQS7_9ACTN|nr:branched-chain amino acid ABC transporter permease [Asanoa ferruginea]REF98333.1 amino acid/amide ABC transporter membrane protein 2 (HAAT family) [Asanoa ferruginea]GIF52772.1 branched-chain amino acid ABC transporter permease [Asanoa ferruginea]
MTASTVETASKAATGPRVKPWHLRMRSSLFLAVTLLAVTAVVTSTQFDYNIFLYNTFLLTCVGALAMNLLMGTTGLVSVGSAGFLAAGAFGGVWFDRMGLPFVACVLGGGLLAAVLGLIVSLPAIRLRGLALGLGTISVHFVVIFVVDQYQQRTPGVGVIGFNLPPLFGTTVQVQHQWAWLLLGVVLLALALVSLLGAGRTGRALRLIRDQEQIASTQAIPVTGYKMMIFAITSFLFGAQGALTGFLVGQVSSEQFTLTLAMQYLAMVMVGGLDSVWGAALGAAIFTALPFAMQHLVSAVLGAQQASLNGAKYGVIAYAVLVIAFIVGAPGGLVRLVSEGARKIQARRK